MTSKFSFSAFIAVLFMAPALVSALMLNRSLDVGMSGADVTALQTFLAADPTLYPQGLVTGYYGFLTKSAVANFQSRNGISAVGRVGPITLPVLNAQMGGGLNDTTSAPIISSASIVVSTSSARVSWNTNVASKGTVYYSESPLTIYESGNTVTVSGTAAMTDGSYGTGKSVMVPNLKPNTQYYYLIHASGPTGSTNITWPASFRTNN